VFVTAGSKVEGGLRTLDDLTEQAGRESNKRVRTNDIACTISPNLAMDVIEDGWDGSVLAEPFEAAPMPRAVCFRSVPCAFREYRNPEVSLPTSNVPNNEQKLNR
jgi:hypothetical protein